MEIKNKNFSEERALYAAKDLVLNNCSFKGIEDGESALKEAQNIIINDTFFDLRYPLWHVTNLEVKSSEMTPNCRAALWYSKNIKINDTLMHGIKALRECKNIELYNIDSLSPEYLWKCNRFKIKKMKLESEYAFLESKNGEIEDLDFKGKYSFQYIENVHIKNSKLDTKDCFWHAKNVVIEDSLVIGEYLAWYSENVTFIRCKIVGTQPLCYCKNLKLIDCTMEKCDLSFEYSEVEASINSHIDSIKNPLSGVIKCDSVGEIILKDSIYESKCEIITKK